MLENINLAFQGVWSHKLRSFLTMLGIIIGIAAIITIVSTIKGTNEQIKQNLIGAGNNVVNVTLMQDNNQMDFSYASVPQGISMITSEMRDEIDKLDKVQEASLYYSRSWADGVCGQQLLQRQYLRRRQPLPVSSGLYGQLWPGLHRQ